MAFKSDWHIHTHNSWDSACMKIADLFRIARERGIEDYGITDHLNTFSFVPDIEASRKEFLESNPSPRAHFGVEVNVTAEWNLYDKEAPQVDYGENIPLGIALNEELIERLGIEYVVGGTHGASFAPLEPEPLIRDYHRQNMFLAAHPLMTIVAHPWWWSGHWREDDGVFRTKPWFEDFGVIPQSMHDEFASALKEHDTVLEVNLGGMLLTSNYPEPFKRQYLEYLANMKAKGVTLSIGSDCHGAMYETDFEKAEAMLATVGITNDDFWLLAPRKN